MIGVFQSNGISQSKPKPLIGMIPPSFTATFGQAAKRLNISQPALSAQIAQMEEFFGGPLFQRASSGVTLTSDGALIGARVRRILADLGVNISGPVPVVIDNSGTFGDVQRTAPSQRTKHFERWVQYARGEALALRRVGFLKSSLPSPVSRKTLQS